MSEKYVEILCTIFITFPLNLTLFQIKSLVFKNTQLLHLSP